MKIREICLKCNKKTAIKTHGLAMLGGWKYCYKHREEQINKTKEGFKKQYEK